MSREFSVRMNGGVAAWVRSSGQSATRVLAGILSAAQQGRLQVSVRDPGPGPERLTVRVPAWALPKARVLAHARDNLVALRKLFFAGYQWRRVLPSACPVRMLPAAASDSRLLPAPVRALPTVRVTVPPGHLLVVIADSASLVMLPFGGDTGRVPGR
jgi:hypothetical protein